MINYNSLYYFCLVHEHVAKFERNIGGICAYVHKSILKSTDCVFLYSVKESGFFGANIVLAFIFSLRDLANIETENRKNGINSLENECARSGSRRCTVNYRR